MKLLGLSADILGFVALSTGAVLGSICSSLLGCLLSGLLTLGAKIGRFLRQMMKRMQNCLQVSTVEKNGTKWHRLRIGNYSFMIGRKENVS